VGASRTGSGRLVNGSPDIQQTPSVIPNDIVRCAICKDNGIPRRFGSLHDSLTNCTVLFFFKNTKHLRLQRVVLQQLCDKYKREDNMKITWSAQWCRYNGYANVS
jgi:hypothetical protein